MKQIKVYGYSEKQIARQRREKESYGDISHKLPKWALKVVADAYRDDDGYWANLKDGFNIGGASAAHEQSIKKLLEVLRHEVEEGEPS